MFLIHVYIVVQFYTWFKFFFVLIMSLKQRKISFEPRIKLNHNINTTPYFSAIKIFYCTLEERILPFVSSRRIKLHSKEMPHEYF